MKLIIAGSRSVFPINTITKKFDRIAAIELIDKGVRWVEKELKQSVSCVISGRAVGPDRYGELWARENGVSLELYPAYWDRGKQAGMERNILMAEAGDVLLAFWDQKSTGTKHMMAHMKKLGKPVFVRYVV